VGEEETMSEDAEEAKLKEWRERRAAEEKALALQLEIDRVWQEKLDREAEAKRAKADGVERRGRVLVDYNPFAKSRMP
jgi:hypothetical protein